MKITFANSASLAGLLVVPAVFAAGPITTGSPAQATSKITVRVSETSRPRPFCAPLDLGGLDEVCITTETTLTDHDLDLFLEAARAEFDTTDYAYLYDDED